MATLQLAIDSRKAQMGASQFDAATRRVTHSARNTALAVAAVGTAIAYTSLKFVKVASDAQETQAKFDTVFRHLRLEANAWADDFGSSVGRAHQDVKKWMAGLQDTFVPLGIAREKAFELSKSLTTLAVDVASFNNKADAEVIRDFTSALVGNHETVRKYGIIIGESAIQQEAYNKGIDKSYKNLTDLQKVMLRYSLIQKGTTDAQGDAIRTGDSYANQLKRLQSTWTNIQQTLGEALLPAFTKALTSINTLLTENQGEIKRWAETVVGKVGTVVDSLKAVKTATGDIYEQGKRDLWIDTWAKEMYRLETGETKAFKEKPLMGLSVSSYYEPKQPELFQQLLKRAEAEKVDIEEWEAFNKKWSLQNANRPVPVAGPTLPTGAAGTDGGAAQTRVTAEQERAQKAALSRVQDMHRALAEEQRIIGMVTESRERGMDIIRLENEARAAGTLNVAAEVEQYKRALSELRKAEQLRSIADNMGDAFGRAFGDIAFGAQEAGKAIQSLVLDIARLVMQQRITQPLANVISDFAYNAFRPVPSTTMSVQADAWLNTPPGHRYGAAFNKGRIVPFGGGGVVDELTYFPMAGGRAGMMGESGPEAVMPLRRGANGRLGVEAAGDSGRGETKITVELVNQTSAPVKAESSGVRFDGEKMIVGVILRDFDGYGPIRQAMMSMDQG